jgi:HK97 family phage major capsid protein
MLRSIARGEARGAFTSATEEPNSHGERLPTYLGRNSELVFEEFSRAILGILSYSSIAMQVATRISTTTNRVTIPRADENVEAELYLENCEIKPVLIKTSSFTINVEKLGARAQVSNELLEDAFTSVPALVATKFAYAFAVKIDQLWLEGDATAGITGLLPQITNSVTAGPKLTHDNLVDVVSKISPYAVNPVWIMSPAGLAKLQSAASSAIGYDLAAPMRMQVFGAPVYKSLALPDDVLGLYGDFRQASTIVDRSNGLTINASRERAIEYDQTVFVGTQRFGVASTGMNFVSALKTA